MFFDRDDKNRKERQIAYRNQLKNQIEMNNSMKLQRSRESYGNNRRVQTKPSQPQTFSLLKNIEVQQQSRKNKQSQYYAQLRNQIQKQKQQKRRKKQQKALRQRQEQQKIMKQNEVLRRRAQVQKMNQKNKGKSQQATVEVGNQTGGGNNNFNYKKRNDSTSQIETEKYRPNNRQNFNTNNYQSRFKGSQNYQNTIQSENQRQRQRFNISRGNQNQPAQFQKKHFQLYANRVENQNFNFIPQKRYMNSYFQQILGQRRRFEQQAAQISQLNKIFYSQKSHASKIQSRGLSELKKLLLVLDEKRSYYMGAQYGQK